MPRLKQDGDVRIRDYIITLLEHWGRDFTTCEECGNKMGVPYLHHTKYDGATIYDILIVCAKCNSKTENKGLV